MTADAETALPGEDGAKRGPLSSEERDAFLARGLMARLACLDERGWPYSVPVWFHWDGSQFWIVASPGSAWAAYLSADPRVSLCIDEPESLRRVMCQGEAHLVEGSTVNGRWVPYGRLMSARYLGAKAPAYDSQMVDFAGTLFAVTPVRLLTWQGPGKH